MSIDEPSGAVVVNQDPEVDESPRAAIAQAHRPAVSVAGPYGHPLHPILVTVPIGAWVAAVAFDVASHVSSDPRTFAPGAFWLVVIGIAGALAAAVFGVLDMLAIRPGTKARRTAIIHLALNAAVVVLFAVTLPARRGYVEHSTKALFKDHHTAATPWGAFGVSVVALLLLGVSGWLGGKLAYRYGVRVADEADQAAGHVPSTTATATTETTATP